MIFAVCRARKKARQDHAILLGFSQAPAARVGVQATSAMVGRFTVRGDIQTFALLVFRHTQAADSIGDLVCDEGHDAGPHDGEQHTFGLDPELAQDQAWTVQPRAPRAWALNRPVSKAPTIPPTPFRLNMSSESSARSMHFEPLTPQTHTAPATIPITNAPTGPTRPRGRDHAHQTCNGARSSAQHRGLTFGGPLGEGPGQDGASYGDQRVQKREDGSAVGRQGRPRR